MTFVEMVNHSNKIVPVAFLSYFFMMSLCALPLRGLKTNKWLIALCLSSAFICSLMLMIWAISEREFLWMNGLIFILANCVGYICLTIHRYDDNFHKWTNHEKAVFLKNVFASISMMIIVILGIYLKNGNAAPYYFLGPVLIILIGTNGRMYSILYVKYDSKYNCFGDESFSPNATIKSNANTN